jgi:hypothetical protein
MRDWIELAGLALAGLIIAAGCLMMAAINLVCLGKAIVQPTPANIVMTFLSFFLWPIVFSVWRMCDNNESEDGVTTEEEFSEYDSQNPRR